MYYSHQQNQHAMHKIKLGGRVWLLAMFGILSFAAKSQTYVSQYLDQGGYPGTANSEYYSSTTGWKEVLPGGITTNQWSPQDTIPFAFALQGAPVSTFRVSGNGLLTFLSSPGVIPPNPVNATAPTIADANMPDSTIASYWTGWVGATQGGDKVYSKTFGTAPNRQHWIKWHSYAWGAGNTSADYLFAAIVLEESTNNIYVVGMYADPDVRTVPCVVGVKVDGSTSYEITNPSYPNLATTTPSQFDRYSFYYSSTNCVVPMFPEDSTLYFSSHISTTLTESPSGMQVEYGPQGFAQGSGSTATSATSDITLSGLTPGQKYHYYLRTDCGGTYSAWAGPYTFKTLCTSTAPFLESFDNNAVWDIDESIDSCWYTMPQVLRLTWNADSNRTPSSNTGPELAVGGTGQYMFMESNYGSTGDKAYLQLPALDVTTLSTPTLGFYYHMYGNSMGTLSVEYSLDTGATWTTGWSQTGQVQTAYTDGWLPSFVTLPSSNFILIRFVGEKLSGSLGDMAIDEVSVNEAPACAFPGIVNVEAALSSNSLNVNWTNKSGSFRVEWGVKGFVQGTGTTNTALVNNDSTYTLTGLYQNTEYDVYVYGDCTSSGNGYSFISTPVTGYTLPSVPYLEDFDGGTIVPDERWAEALGVWNDTIQLNETSSNWAIDDWLNVSGSTNDCAKLPIYSSSTSISIDDWLLTPLFDLGSGGNFEMTFNAGITENYNTNPSYMQSDDTLVIVINTDTNQTWLASNTISTISTANEPSLSGSFYKVDLSGYTGLVRIGFFMKSTVVNTQNYNIYIDDLQLRVKPACPAPIGVSFAAIGSSDISVTWDSVDDANEYIVYVTERDSSATSIHAIIDTVTSDSAFITGLNPNSEYDFYVSTSCTSGPSIIAGPTPFTTNCISIVPAPHSENFENTSTGGSVTGSFGNCIVTDKSSGFEWIVQNATGNNTGNALTGPIYDHTQFPTAGGNYIYTEASYGNEGDSATLTLQGVDVSALTTPGLSFAYHMYGREMGSLFVEVSNDQVNWTTLYGIVGQQQTAEGADWSEVSFDLSVLGYDTVYTRFIGVRGSNYLGDLALDDISFGEFTGCSSPVAFNINQTGDITADLTWNPVANSTISVAISSTGNPMDTAYTTYYTGLSNGSLSVTLPYATCAQFFVRTLCANDTTDWVSGQTICTPCPAFYTAPYTANFTTVEPGIKTLGGLTNCWSFTDGNWETEDASGTNENSLYTGPFYDNTTWGIPGGMYIFMESTSTGLNDSSIVESPIIYTGNLTNGAELSFAYHMYGASTGKLYVNARDINGSWTTVDSIIGEQQKAGGDPWRIRNTYLGGFSDTIVVRFVAVDGASYTSDISLDDISIIEAPSCPAPVVLNHGNVTETTVDLNWTSYNASATFLAEFGPSGYTPGSGTEATLSSNPGTLIGLTAGTCYDVYIREVCSAGDTSIWLGPVSFCTGFTCGTVATPALPASTPLCANTTLSVTGGTPNMVWENAEGDVIVTGATFESDSITGDTTLYARAFDEVHPFSIGPKTDIATSGYSSAQGGTMISVLNPVRIDSVVMKSTNMREGTIQFYRPLAGFNNHYSVSTMDSVLELTQEVRYSLPQSGEFYVPVNVVLNPGQYFVNVTFDTIGTGTLFRSTSGANYPYVFDNIMSLDSAVGTASVPTTRVFYLFDWNVTAVCTSDLDSTQVEYAPEVRAAINGGLDVAGPTATYWSADFNAYGSENAVSYAWDFGDGSTATGDTVSHQYLTNGTFTVQLTVTGVCGDTETITTTVTTTSISISEAGLNGVFETYPNPTSGALNIHIQLNESSDASIRLSALSGQILDEITLENGTEWTEQLDLSHLPSGVYIITVQSNAGLHVERIVKH